ncbi:MULTISPECIES: glycosyltransferase family 2 protein [Tenacibaculum]|uniref:glycosyltransferase family 2 protein n=1 Tax=Tenacibaculum TaxID=104267 RepID=UPI001F0A956C|nr:MULTISPECIES: glycosyltransferase family 2 protein [Tenacibaculum]MCH3881950.1 glycosyltransferase [Tenacibaculum aquimarinum]MDO6600703.1 glycosyltransferase family 2 protein [Tenacibaculum sp. 1_MG-2023]
MKFSLIVCTYMRPKAIITLLNSVKEQTLYPNEIIIVDGSINKDTQHLFLSKIFKNIRYFLIEEKHRGLTNQRNFGISKVAKDSEIVCFLDDDIVLEKDYFEKLLKTYIDKPEALAVCGYITNEVKWSRSSNKKLKNKFIYDGWFRKEPFRFRIRKMLGLIDNTKPGFMPLAANGRYGNFLPPSGKTYEVEQMMGGITSYKKDIFKKISFSSYFEGYGLYEDSDFTLRLSKIGKIYINTNAKLAHYHAEEGRPNKFKYGKMVLRNGWYVWRIKYANPSFKSRIKWNATALLLTLIRATNILTEPNKKEALTETLGRISGWFSLLFNKPKIEH